MKALRPPHTSRRGFSLLELLIVASLCAVVFTSGSLAYRAVAQNQRRATTFQEVTLTSAVATNFFPGTTDTTIDSYTTPSYGRAAIAQRMRNLFYEDVESSCAVFALPRLGNLNTIRERVITIGNRHPGAYDTPAGFLSLLGELSSTATRAAVFRTYRGAPADSVTVGTVTTPLVNGSVFILQPSGSPTEIWVRAVYEIDYIGFNDTAQRTSAYPSGVPCVHASVRRYVDGTLTNFYDVVFRESTTAMVGVPFVHLERAVRTNVVESAVTNFKVAANHPFYLMWWPDPAASSLRGTAITTYTGLRTAYSKHEGQTSFTFVVPQYPCY